MASLTLKMVLFWTAQNFVTNANIAAIAGLIKRNDWLTVKIIVQR